MFHVMFRVPESVWVVQDIYYIISGQYRCQLIHTNTGLLIITEHKLLLTATDVGSISVVTEVITATIIGLAFVNIYSSF